MAGSPTALPGSGISVPRNGVGTGPSLGAGVQSGQHWKLCALLSGRAGSGLEGSWVPPLLRTWFSEHSPYKQSNAKLLNDYAGLSNTVGG